MLRKLGSAVVVGLVACGLAACGSGQTENSDAAAENLEKSIAAVEGVVEVNARYQVNVGMGSTAHVRVTAETGTQPLDSVLNDALLAFADASANIRPQTSVSFQVTEEGQKNTVSPEDIGLQQNMTSQEISDFASGQ